MLGTLYRFTNRASEAVPHFVGALSLPRTSDDWFRACEGLASCYVMLQDGAKAIEVLREGIQDDPNQTLLHYKLGVCLFDAGNCEGAIRESDPHRIARMFRCVLPALCGMQPCHPAIHGIGRTTSCRC